MNIEIDIERIAEDFYKASKDTGMTVEQSQRIASLWIQEVISQVTEFASEFAFSTQSPFSRTYNRIEDKILPEQN